MSPGSTRRDRSALWPTRGAPDLQALIPAGWYSPPIPPANLMGSSPPPRDSRPPRAAEDTLRVSAVATARYTAEDRARARRHSRLLWAPLFVLLDGLRWLFAHVG